MRIVVPALAAAVLCVACSATPSVVKTDAMMTMAEIEAAGLVCRTQPPADSNIPRTICASQSAWDAFDRKARLASEDLFAAGRELPNSGRFNRN